MAKPTALHWSDITAERLIKQKGDKDDFVLASGITPSGVVHFGNFREVITVDLVARALRAKGKNVRFIFSWDDYDTFRKVPANLPKQDLLEEYLFQPIVDTPDPHEQAESYAAFHEENFEAQLDKVGVKVEPIYQAKKYRNGDYADQMIFVLKNRDKIKAILDEHRTQPLPEQWQPVSIYCPKYKTDRVQNVQFDGQETLTYEHMDHDYKGEVNVRSSGHVKLPWRVDWPMRWAFEKVDFEPGGKDHSSEGGSFTTAKEIVKLFEAEAPIYLQYDFVSVKGAGGKMSSSKGNLITVNDVLKVYSPEMVRWIFASYKTNVDFAVSFDLDVIKTYEDFDRQERLAHDVDQGNAKKQAMAKRVFQLSQLDENHTELNPDNIPFRPSVRHLCNLLQINEGDIKATRKAYGNQIKNEKDEQAFEERSKCALYWLENYAPEDFKFRVNAQAPEIEKSPAQSAFLSDFRKALETSWESFETDKALHEKMYEIIHAHELPPAEVFTMLYQLLISKEKGPKLAGFIRTIGKEKTLKLI